MHRASARSLACVLLAASAILQAAPGKDILIDATHVFPESITSTSAGAVITGSFKGVIFRAQPGESLAKAWIRPTPENGLQAVFGVLADEKSNTLWVCSVPNPFERSAHPKPSAVVALDLKSGASKGIYDFPGGGTCNDIAIARDGSAYATDTPNGRLLRLPPGGKALEVFGQDEKLKGIDGLVFSGDGTLYINIVSSGALLRVGIADGRMGQLTELKVSQPLAGPDGFRLISGNRFLIAEGSGGRIDEVVIEGDTAQVRVLREGLNSSPGVTLVGKTVYAIEGKIGYLIDPKLKGQDPGPFTIHAIALN